jgi:GNAT superfamily N-acetyltransferase
VVWDQGVAVTLSTPDVAGLSDVLQALREWQTEASPFQLHPGDLGWFWQFGAQATAAAVRTWRRDGHLLAVGLVDSATVFRLTTAPSARLDQDLAQQLVQDLSDPGRGVLPAGKVAVEAPNDAVVQDRLLEAGWTVDEPWTPLHLDLSEPVDRPPLRIEVIGPEQASASTAVHRSSFGSPRFTDHLWHTMTTGLPYRDARCLLGYDEEGTAVAEVTVWSAGPGRPGLLEPMGVHADHRGRGYGRAICLAAAAALQDLGSSSATVCTPSSNVGGIATYEAAGYQRRPERRDRARGA